MSTSYIPTNEKYHVLNARRLPARLTYEQVGVLLGFSTEDLPILVSAKLLLPLGKPSPSAGMLRYRAGREREGGVEPRVELKAVSA